jgi:hypothetical protein
MGSWTRGAGGGCDGEFGVDVGAMGILCAVRQRLWKIWPSRGYNLRRK